MCRLFEQSVEAARRRYVLFIFGYVIMPEHVHLLISEPRRATLALVLQAVKSSLSKKSADRPFWTPRYYDFNVYSTAKHKEKLRYLHRNPVSRGLVLKPQDWPWSSFYHYQTGTRGVIEIESPWTAALRQGLRRLGGRLNTQN